MNRSPATMAAFVALFLVAAPGAYAQQARTPAPAPAGQADTVVDATFKTWDADHNGVISLAEFRGGWDGIRQRAEAKVEARLREQFDRVDANHNGGIDAGEYGNLLLVREAGKAGKPVPQLSAFDGNRDQRLQFDEYLKLVADLAASATRQPAGRTP